MSENDKNVPIVICHFHKICGKRGTLFQKRRFQGFISEILRVVGLLGEKFTFFNSLGTTKISRRLRLSVYINVILLINFPEQFELFFYFKYSRKVIKFYNLSDKTLKQTLEKVLRNGKRQFS